MSGCPSAYYLKSYSKCRHLSLSATKILNLKIRSSRKLRSRKLYFIASNLPICTLVICTPKSKPSLTNSYPGNGKASLEIHLRWCSHVHNPSNWSLAEQAPPPLSICDLLRPKTYLEARFALPSCLFTEQSVSAQHIPLLQVGCYCICPRYGL